MFYPSRNKYKNKKVIYDKIKFDSELEGLVYLKLKELARDRDDIVYRLQPRYTVHDGYTFGGRTIRKIDYVADFEILVNGKVYVLDTKGVLTDVFRIKEKMFMKKYNREIIKIKSVRAFADWFKEVAR